jgi:hypothetical protein
MTRDGCKTEDGGFGWQESCRLVLGDVLIVVGVVCLETEALRRGFLGGFEQQEEAGDYIQDLGREVVQRHIDSEYIEYEWSD